MWQISYMILHKVSAVTHAVANCVKRVVLIVASVIFFQTPVSPVNALGKFPFPCIYLFISSYCTLFENVNILNYCLEFQERVWQ